MERSGHYDNFDQGIAFFLPNMTWIQPPGYVHQMISQTWADQALSTSVSDMFPYPTSAQKTLDNKILNIRMVNNQGNAGSVSLTLTGFTASSTVNVLTLSSSNVNAANTPANPTAVSPVRSQITFNGNTGSISLPPYSFVVLTFTAA